MGNVKLVLVLLGVSCSCGVVIRSQSSNIIPNPDGAIDYGLDMHHWNDKLCLEILLVDCNNYVSAMDEKICGTNGVEYPDHCHFAHTRCKFLHSDNHIEVANHGPCSATTVAPATTSAPATNPPVSVVQTTPQMTTTTNPIYGIMQNVFCQNIDSIDCQNLALEVICGTDNNIYPNNCEFSKKKCEDPALLLQDVMNCLQSSA